MAGSRQPDSSAPSEVIVRDHADGDYGACRSLWAELTEYHRGIYGDPSIGGDDPGAAFGDYLATPHRLGSWVAESHGRIVGLTGLFDRGASGEVEPVVVAEAARGRGTGRLLIGRVIAHQGRRAVAHRRHDGLCRDLRRRRPRHDVGVACPAISKQQTN